MSKRGKVSSFSKNSKYDLHFRWLIFHHLRTIWLTEIIISNLNNLQEFDYENMGGNLLWMSDDMFNSRTKAGYLGNFYSPRPLVRAYNQRDCFNSTRLKLVSIQTFRNVTHSKYFKNIQQFFWAVSEHSPGSHWDSVTCDICTWTSHSATLIWCFFQLNQLHWFTNCQISKYLTVGRQIFW